MTSLNGGRLATALSVTHVALAITAVALAAQTRAGPVVTGTLHDALSGAPVEGAMIVLLDGDDSVVQRSMTGADGLFVLASPRAGRFVLRADRIGHESTFSDPVELNAGDTTHVAMTADVRAVELDAIDIEADPRCVFRPDEGRAVARLWGEARKSLESATWSAQLGLYEYEFVEFERLWDRSQERLRDQQLRRRVEMGQAMFGSVPVASLIEEGFIVAEGQDRVYRGPDAAVMLSDPFLDTHCFRISRAREANRVALEFEPLESVDVADIHGVIWLDRDTAELLSIEYRYINTRSRWGEGRFGGSIEFDRLPAGPIIVRRWSIRMPSVERRFFEQQQLRGVLEQGAEVLRVSEPRGETLRTYPAGRVRGVVTRGQDQRPAPGVVVALDGIDAWAETDHDGTFEIGPVIGGPYLMRVHDEGLTRVGHTLPSVPIQVEYDQVTERNLHLAEPAMVLFEYCGRRRDYARTAVMMGRVRSEGGVNLAKDARVRVRWIGEDGRAKGIDAESNEAGFYVLCGVPRNTHISVTVDRGGEPSIPITVDVPANATEVALDLVLPPTG